MFYIVVVARVMLLSLQRGKKKYIRKLRFNSLNKASSITLIEFEGSIFKEACARFISPLLSFEFDDCPFNREIDFDSSIF